MAAHRSRSSHLLRAALWPRTERARPLLRAALYLERHLNRELTAFDRILCAECRRKGNGCFVVVDEVVRGTRDAEGCLRTVNEAAYRLPRPLHSGVRRRCLDSWTRWTWVARCTNRELTAFNRHCVAQGHAPVLFLLSSFLGCRIRCPLLPPQRKFYGFRGTEGCNRNRCTTSRCHGSGCHHSLDQADQLGRHHDQASDRHPRW